MESSICAHVQAIQSKSQSDNGPEIWCTTPCGYHMLTEWRDLSPTLQIQAIVFMRGTTCFIRICQALYIGYSQIFLYSYAIKSVGGLGMRLDLSTDGGE